jgi:NAD-dependent SIR2 family protein deacetylase
MLIGQSDEMVITAAACMGVDSGLTDFRSHDGFWKTYPELARSAMGFAEVASPFSFRQEPDLAWGFYGHRLDLYRKVVPHRGFEILRRWARKMARGAFVFTSNVDGQFQKAGFSEERIEEHHGSIHRLCLAPCTDATWAADAIEPDVDEAACRWRGALPRCPGYGGLARPNLLMFSDGQWLRARYESQARCLADWLGTVHRPVVVEIGAGTAIPSVRRFGERLVRERRRHLIRINVSEAEVARHDDISLPMTSLGALSAIDDLGRCLLRAHSPRTLAVGFIQHRGGASSGMFLCGLGASCVCRCGSSGTRPPLGIRARTFRGSTRRRCTRPTSAGGRAGRALETLVTTNDVFEIARKRVNRQESALPQQIVMNPLKRQAVKQRVQIAGVFDIHRGV